MAGPDLVQQLDSELDQAQRALRDRGCPPAPLIAYAHHPLSTIHASPRPSTGRAAVAVEGGACGAAAGTLCPGEEDVGAGFGAEFPVRLSSSCCGARLGGCQMRP